MYVPIGVHGVSDHAGAEWIAQREERRSGPSEPDDAPSAFQSGRSGAGGRLRHPSGSGRGAANPPLALPTIDSAALVDASAMMLVTGALLALGILAALAAGRLRVPGLVLFLGLGMAIGSDGLGLIDFDDFELTRTVGVVALALILFEGGLAAGWSEIRPVLAPAHTPSPPGSPGCRWWRSTLCVTALPRPGCGAPPGRARRSPPRAPLCAPPR